MQGALFWYSKKIGEGTKKGLIFIFAIRNLPIRNYYYYYIEIITFIKYMKQVKHISHTKKNENLEKEKKNS